MQRLAILISCRGSNFIALADAVEARVPTNVIFHQVSRAFREESRENAR